MAKKIGKQKRGKGIGFWLILLFLVMSFAAAAYAGLWYSNWANVSGDTGKHETPAVVKDEKINILLMGVDKRGNEPARSDTIMVAFLDLKQQTVRLMSIPRDTRVQIPGRGTQKINHSHAFGGAELTMGVVSDLIGVPIDKYMEVDFSGFEKIIDTLGGVEFNVEKRMYYKAEGINLKAGLQKLDGKDALGYVRYRSDSDDMTRVKRQQKFLKAVAKQALSIDAALKLPKLLPQVENALTTNINNGELISLGLKFGKIDPESIETTTLPGVGQYVGNISYYLVDEPKMREVVDYYSGKTSVNPEAKSETTSSQENK